MYKYVIVLLALAAVAAAQLIYSGVSGPSFHGPFASSTNTGIRRGLPTGYLSTTYYTAPAYAPAVYAPAAYAPAAYYY